MWRHIQAATDTTVVVNMSNCGAVEGIAMNKLKVCANATPPKTFTSLV